MFLYSRRIGKTILMEKMKMKNELPLRLQTIKEYLREALKKPEENKLYIEDLQASIILFEGRLDRPEVMEGFEYAD